MRISDWSSDVCSSDLHHHVELGLRCGALAPDRADFLVDLRQRLRRLVGLHARRHAEILRPALRVDEAARAIGPALRFAQVHVRSEEHTSELQSLMRISYAVFCLKKKKKKTVNINIHKLIRQQNR